MRSPNGRVDVNIQVSHEHKRRIGLYFISPSREAAGLHEVLQDLYRCWILHPAKTSYLIESDIKFPRFSGDFSIWIRLARVGAYPVGVRRVRCSRPPRIRRVKVR